MVHIEKHRVPNADMCVTPLIVFLHIAKTAGVSLNSLLIRSFGANVLAGNVPGATQSRCGMYRLNDVARTYAALSDSERNELRCCIGHNFFGIHNLIDRRCRYVTLVRDPIDRCISAYNYLLQTEMIPTETSFETFVSKKLVICNSFQTRQISGVASLDLSSDFDPGTLLTGSSVRENREVRRMDYYKALYNIRRHFMLCAPSERFDEALLILARMFGWSLSDIVYEKLNVTKRFVGRDDIPTALIKQLHEQNRFDQKLYDFAATRFDRFVTSLGRKFQDDLAAFRSLLAEQNQKS